MQEPTLHFRAMLDAKVDHVAIAVRDHPARQIRAPQGADASPGNACGLGDSEQVVVAMLGVHVLDHFGPTQFVPPLTMG